MSAEFVTSTLRMLQILDSVSFLTALDHCPVTLLNVSAHLVSGRPVLLLPVPRPHTDVARTHLR